MHIDKIQSYLANLNEDQQAVVAIGPGRASVSGAPGSGKTRALVARIARLVLDGLDPQYILAMTFTRNAAQEMTKRLEDLGIFNARIGTIHSTCLNILKGENHFLNRLRMDERNALPMELKKTITNLKRNKKINNKTIDLSSVERFISFSKATGLCFVSGNPYGTNSEAEHRQLKLAQDMAKDDHLGDYDIDPLDLLTIYTAMENRRAELGLYDYDDMMLWAWMLLIADPGCLHRWRTKWSLIMMDEAQDSTAVQWDVAFLLSGMESKLEPKRTAATAGPYNLMVFNDTAQAIYAWRAAATETAVDYAISSTTQLCSLPINYRSTPPLCAVATAFITGEEWNVGGEIISSKGRELTALDVMSCYEVSGYPNMFEEAKRVIAECEKLAASGTPWGEIAVLARLSGILHVAEVVCLQKKIPYIKRASGTFLESKEVQDILAYLRVATEKDVDGKSIRRTVLAPFKFIGRQSMDFAEQIAEREGLDYVAALLRDTYLTGRQRRSLVELRDILYEVHDMVRPDCKPAPRPTCDALRFIVRQTGYADYIAENDGTVAPDAGKMSTIEQLIEMSYLHPNAYEFLDAIDHMAISLKSAKKTNAREAEDGDTSRLVLSTIHRAKGEEYKYVFITDVVQGRFPWNMAFSYDEEIRLMYVAFTRAKERVFISHSVPPRSIMDSVRLGQDDDAESIETALQSSILTRLNDRTEDLLATLDGKTEPSESAATEESQRPHEKSPGGSLQEGSSSLLAQ